MSDACARCGTPRHQWIMQGLSEAGVRGAGGKLYCSQSCADTAQADGVSRAQQEAYLEDDVKGPSEEPDHMEHTGKRPMPPGQVGHGSGSAGGTSAPPTSP